MSATHFELEPLAKKAGEPGELLNNLQRTVLKLYVPDEPGVYIEGSHGIRTENELLCVRDEKNNYGQFMRFEMLTWAPIDLDGIDTRWLNPEDIRQLDTYHQMVYEKISPYMDSEEKEWLRRYTRPLGEKALFLG